MRIFHNSRPLICPLTHERARARCERMIPGRSGSFGRSAAMQTKRAVIDTEIEQNGIDFYESFLLCAAYLGEVISKLLSGAHYRFHLFIYFLAVNVSGSRSVQLLPEPRNDSPFFISTIPFSIAFAGTPQVLNQHAHHTHTACLCVLAFYQPRHSVQKC